jgi:hypothetical protein
MIGAAGIAGAYFGQPESPFLPRGSLNAKWW